MKTTEYPQISLAPLAIIIEARELSIQAKVKADNPNRANVWNRSIESIATDYNDNQRIIYTAKSYGYEYQITIGIDSTSAMIEISNAGLYNIAGEVGSTMQQMNIKLIKDYLGKKVGL